MQVVSNGRYWTDSRGYVRRWICRDCGEKWKVADEPLLREVVALGIRMPLRTVLRRFALVALGLPLQVVEHLEYVKAETLRAQLLRFQSDKKTWQSICGLLILKCGVPATHVEEFSAAMNNIASGGQTFHALARAYQRTIRNQKNRRVLAGQITKLLGRPVVISQTGGVQLAGEGGGHSR